MIILKRVKLTPSDEYNTYTAVGLEDVTNIDGVSDYSLVHLGKGLLLALDDIDLSFVIEGLREPHRISGDVSLKAEECINVDSYLRIKNL